MKVHRDILSLIPFTKAVVTIGTFDGVHAGHRKLIERIKELAHQEGGESVLITFEPHPRSVIYPDESLKLLTTLEEKTELLKSFDIDHLVVAPFTKEFSLLSAREYAEHFLFTKFHPAVVVMGYNHQFGHHRDGNIELLRKLSSQYHFRVEEIEKQLVDEIEVSSTRIRIALQEGDVETANHLLGHNYSLEGNVIKGDQLGRKLGYPTANILVEDKFKLIPADGIYAIKAHIAEGSSPVNGVMSIGMRPTVSGKHRTIEAHLFNFDQDIYQKKIKVDFIQWIRDETKFKTLELLTAQMKSDEAKARSILEG